MKITTVKCRAYEVDDFFRKRYIIRNIYSNNVLFAKSQNKYGEVAVVVRSMNFLINTYSCLFILSLHTFYIILKAVFIALIIQSDVQ